MRPLWIASGDALGKSCHFLPMEVPELLPQQRPPPLSVVLPRHLSLSGGPLTSPRYVQHQNQQEGPLSYLRRRVARVH